MILKRPLKAPTDPITDFATLQALFPMLVSDKEDGIRCLIHPELGPVSQKLLPIPNDYVREGLARYSPQGLDGELVTFNEVGKQDDFNTVQSKIMKRKGQPDFAFLVFDCFEKEYDAYEDRLFEAKLRVVHYQNNFNPHAIRLLPQTWCYDVKQLEQLEKDALFRNKEGLMLRNPRGWYKQGRSTLNEGYLLKVKRFTDDEAIVTGVVERMKNCNAATTDHNGLTKRSKHKANLVPAGVVGSLTCLWRGLTLQVDGLTDFQRALWWQHPEKIVGQTIKFKYQPFGMKDLPRAPKFVGIRYD